MKINIVSWTMGAYWKWDVDDEDICGICQNAYDGCCPNCTIPGDGCPLIWGECNHVFHLHCLMKWLDSSANNENCPMDRRPWKTATAPNTKRRATTTTTTATTATTTTDTTQRVERG